MLPAEVDSLIGEIMMRCSVKSLSVMLGITICIVSAFAGPTSLKDNQECHAQEPWLRRDLAIMIVNHMSDDSGLLHNVNSESPSVLIQLALWADLAEKHRGDKLTSGLDVDKLLDRADPGINSILWLLAHEDPNRIGFEFNEIAVDRVNNWANTILVKHPLRLVEVAIIKNRIFGNSPVSLEELMRINHNIEDPAVLFHIAGRYESSGRYADAHEHLVRSIENGLAKGFFGLGLMEMNHFDGCVNRGKIYINIFDAVWN